MADNLRTTLLITTLLLSGCATKPPSISFDRAASGVKNIAFATPACPAKPILVSLAPVTAYPILLGPFGSVADQSVQQDHAEHFAELLTAQRFSPCPVLEADIKQDLISKGYEVKSVDADRSSGDFLALSPEAGLPTSDAYLDVVVTDYGYAASTITSPYQPAVNVKFKLVRSRDSSIVMQGSFGYSLFRDDERPDDAFNYWHYDDFSADQTRAIKGMQEGFSKAAVAVTDALD